MFCNFVTKPSEKVIVNLDCLIYTFFADFPKSICQLKNVGVTNENFGIKTVRLIEAFTGPLMIQAVYII